jgi:hypothetical protein
MTPHTLGIARRGTTTADNTARKQPPHGTMEQCVHRTPRPTEGSHLMSQQAIQNEPDQLCDEQGPIPAFPPIQCDPKTGRMIPLSDEEWAARRSAAIRALKAIEQLPDDDAPGIEQEIMRGIDSHRPHRPLFEGMY